MTNEHGAGAPNEDANQGRESLYERIGGAQAVERLVDDFYDRVLADPLLAPIFEDADLDRLLRMQRAFFTAALGGHVTYDERPLAEAHHGHGITRRHFARFVDHLLATLQRFDLRDEDVKRIIARVNTYSDEVVGQGYGASG